MDVLDEFIIIKIIIIVSYLVVAHEVGHDINWNREDDCTVVLRRNTVQSLQVSQLK